MTGKCYAIFDEIKALVPDANLVEIKKRRGGKFLFPIYINSDLFLTDVEALDLSTRSNNCLRRVGFQNVGEVVDTINGRDDLKRIRNCGEKCVDEIMEKLFCYQYEQIPKDKKVKFINRVIELNN